MTLGCALLAASLALQPPVDTPAQPEDGEHEPADASVDTPLRDSPEPAAPTDDVPSSDVSAKEPEPSAAASEPDSPEARPAASDTVTLGDGTTVQGRVTDVAEGAYVNVRVNEAQRTIPWSEVSEVILRREGGAAVHLDLSRPSFAAEVDATPQTPRIDMLTRDGRPVSLLRLRASSGEMKRRYSTGYDEVCRAPCGINVEAGGGRFFVDRNPWTASKVFELPPGAAHVEILVRPGRVNLRKAGVGLMIGGGAAFPTAIMMLALPRTGRTLGAAGIALLTTSLFAVPVGAIFFAVSRAKATARQASSSLQPRTR
ncbi:MAG: hypothetical protein AAF721_19130 [Myxococcota bacterium]